MIAKKYVKTFSRILNRDMEYTIFGEKGKPAVVFPTGGGRFFQFEDSGMLEACSPYIESGSMQVFAVDGIDWEHFECEGKSGDERTARYHDYLKYLTKEMVAVIASTNNYRGKYMTFGTSLGGYHAMNLLLRYPDIFDTVIAMSGIYNTARYFHDFMNDELYVNSPLLYLQNAIDKDKMEAYLSSKIIASVGQGQWEDDAMADFLTLRALFDEKKIPAFFDVWGYDVTHEFVWWRKQIAYFLTKVL